MAKRWIKDSFNGDGLLAFRETESGQLWATPYDLGGTLHYAGYSYEQFRTEAGSAFYEAPDHTFYLDVRSCLVLSPNFNKEATNVYEWTLNRFPSGVTGWVFLPEALLCFDSIGAIPWGGGISVNAVRVRWDWFSQKVIIGEPSRSNTFSLTPFMEEPEAWYDPLPLLTSPSHPAEYAFKLTTKWDADLGQYKASLTLNGTPVYTDKLFLPNGGGGSWASDAWGGSGIGVVPGAKVAGPTGTHTHQGLMEFTDFRFNYKPIDLTQPQFLHQMARKDGLNGGGAYQMSTTGYRGGTGFGNPLWQISGQ